MQLLPAVKEIKYFDGAFRLGNDVDVVIPSNDEKYVSIASYLIDCIFRLKNIKMGLVISSAGEHKSCIMLSYASNDNCKEHYSITCSPNEIQINGDSSRALRYGVQTLLQIVMQIVMQTSNEVPYLSIDDYPDFQHRGYYHDITRGKVPKLATLKMLAEKLSFYKINELQLYVEHSFAFKNMPELWIDKDPITAEEILELDLHCKALDIDLIPSLATFGHLYELLRLKRYEHLNELDVRASELPHDLWDRMAHYTINPLDNESEMVITSMLDEYIPLFTSKYFNICCDETFDLGKGKSAQKAQENGAGRLYVGFLKKIINVVTKHNKIPMFWGDIVLHYPELIKEIPGNAIFLNWAYGADVTDEATATFSKSGVKQYVCPGVSGWSRFANDISSASQNIRKMVSYGKEYAALGVLNTDWGDCGHVNFISYSYHGLALGASLSWNADSYSVEQDFARALSLIEWNDKSGQIAECLRNLGSLCFYHFGNLYAWVNNKQCLWNKEENVKSISFDTLKDNYQRARDIHHQILKIRNDTASSECPDFDEFLWSSSAISWTLALLNYKKIHEYKQCAAPLMHKQQLIQETGRLCESFKSLWRTRNKESELGNVVAVFKAVIQRLAIM